VQIRLVGGGTFASAAMSGTGYSAPAGLGTDTLSTSATGTTASASLHGLVVNGPVFAIEVMQTASCTNIDATPFPALVVVGFKINSTESVQPPVLRLKGSARRTTTRNRIVLRGTAADQNDDLARIEARVGSRPFRPVQGLENWNTSVRLKPGVNRVQLHAVDATEKKSPLKRVQITRR
jgi:hypothetical protein